MESYNIIFPSVELLPYIRYYWTLDINAAIPVSERVIPTGCIHLVFHKGDRMLDKNKNELQPRSFICGHNSDYTDIVNNGTVSMIVVVFQPSGSMAFFDLPANEFRHNNISLGDIDINELKILEQKIQETIDTKRCIDFIEEYLRRQLHVSKDYNHKRMSTVINEINNQPQVNINILSDIACLSNKQFTRIFTQYIGTTPKEFLRTIRFQRALYLLQVKSQTSLTRLSLECGYYDQSHLIKDFKTFSGYTPTEFISVCQPYSDYFSTL